MLRSCCVSISFAILAATPAFPGLITGVSVNGTVSGSGTVTTECGVALISPPAGCIDVGMGLFEQTVPLTFSGTNTQLGSFGAFGSATGIFGGTVDASATQFVTENVMNGNNLNATLDNQALVSQKGLIHNFSVSVDNSVEILFTLTAESSAFLAQQGTSLSSADLRDSQGNLILSPGTPLCCNLERTNLRVL